MAFGVDDLDGTIDDTTKIYSMAGSEEQNPALTTEELVKMIRSVGRRAVERDTLYKVLRDWTDAVFEADTAFRGNGAKLTQDRVGYLVHPDWTSDPAHRPDAALWTPAIATPAGLAATAVWYRANGLLG